MLEFYFFAMFVPAAVAKAVQYAQVEQLLVERNSQRSIVRATGVARMTIAKLLKKKQQPSRSRCHNCGRKRVKSGAGRRWNSMRCGRL